MSYTWQQRAEYMMEERDEAVAERDRLAAEVERLEGEVMLRDHRHMQQRAEVERLREVLQEVEEQFGYCMPEPYRSRIRDAASTGERHDA